VYSGIGRQEELLAADGIKSQTGGEPEARTLCVVRNDTRVTREDCEALLGPVM
jgi:hypothetical protein